jgi:hypothetical protein
MRLVGERRRPDESSCMVMAIAGTKKTIDPATHMKAPAATWSLSALRPKRRGTAP